MATYRGMDGSATFNSQAMGNLRSWELTTTGAAIDITVKGDQHQNLTGGLVSGSARLTALYDYVTGQKDVIDRLEATTPPGTTATLVLTAATGKTFTLTALYTGHTITSPEGDNPVTAEFSFVTTSKATIV